MSNESIERSLQQARAAVARGDYAVAEKVCGEVLRQRRKHTGARFILAEVAANRGAIDEAIRHATLAVQAEPRHAPYRVALGQLFATNGQYAKATDQFDRALRLQPGLPIALGDKAAVLEREGRHDRARTILEPAVRRGNPPPEVAATYLRLLLREGELAAAIDLGRRVLAAGHAPGPRLRDMCFALAKACERSGDCAGAMEAARRGNAMLAVPFDPAAYARGVDELTGTLTRESLSRLPAPTDPSDVPVFIVGMPRTGSTLVERVIHAHPAAFGADEFPAFHVIASGLPALIGSPRPYPQCVLDLTQETVDAQARSYVDALRRLAPTAARVTNKDLTNFRHLGLVQVLLPRARVISVRRDPVDNCLSCYLEPLIPTAVPYASDLRHLGSFYRQYDRLMRHWLDQLDMAILEVAYEDLVGAQEPTTRRLLEFCGLPWDDACLAFHETERHDRTLSYEQVRKPLYASSVGRAERFGALLDPLREALRAGE